MAGTFTTERMKMELNHKLAQLYASSAEGAEKAQDIEACIEEYQEEYKQVLLNKIEDVNIEGILDHFRERDFEELNESLLSITVDFPEEDRPELLALHVKYVKMLTDIATMQKAVNTAIKAITEELK